MLNLLKTMIGHEAVMYDETLVLGKSEAFKYESDYIKNKRAEVVARMASEGKLLTQGYTPSSLRGASVLTKWAEERAAKA
jgi:hypothetical protein